MQSLRHYIFEVLKEDAYKRHTGQRYKDDIQQFRNAADKPGYYLHFTDTPKIGINPGSAFFPGYYMYPCTQKNLDKWFFKAQVLDFDDKSWAITTPQGVVARYVYLIKTTSDAKIFDLGNAEDRLMKLIDELEEFYGNLIVQRDSKAVHSKKLKIKLAVLNGSKRGLNILQLNDALQIAGMSPISDKKQAPQAIQNLDDFHKAAFGSFASDKQSISWIGINSLKEFKPLVHNGLRGFAPRLLSVLLKFVGAIGKRNGHYVHDWRDGKFYTLIDIENDVKNFIESKGVDYELLAKWINVKSDGIGAFLTLLIGWYPDYDGFLDHNFTLGKYEKEQLYLKPTARSKFEIAMMVDRFEGQKENPPGEPTSPGANLDRNLHDPEEVEAPRIAALNKKLSGERWK